MKTSTFLLILAVYGFLTGGMMVFNAAGLLQDYGVPLPDIYHAAISQYLGITNLGLGLIAFLSRNDGATKGIQNFLIGNAFAAIGSFLKGCYDIFGIGLPASNFFWIDMTVRVLVGFACIYFALKVDTK